MMKTKFRGSTAKWLNMNSPGLSDEGALTRVNESLIATVNGKITKEAIGKFWSEWKPSSQQLK